MKKLVTPIIYFLSLFPLTAITIWIEMIMRSQGWLGEYQGVIDLPTFIMFMISLIIVGAPFFLLVNLLIRRIESLDEYGISDHFRQSLIFYIAGIISLITWMINGFGNSEGDGYLLLWTGISLLGILVNFIFIKNKMKAPNN